VLDNVTLQPKERHHTLASGCASQLKAFKLSTALQPYETQIENGEIACKSAPAAFVCISILMSHWNTVGSAKFFLPEALTVES
jgi:hypothetical protein